MNRSVRGCARCCWLNTHTFLNIHVYTGNSHICLKCLKGLALSGHGQLNSRRLQKGVVQGHVLFPVLKALRGYWHPISPAAVYLEDGDLCVNPLFYNKSVLLNLGWAQKVPTPVYLEMRVEPLVCRFTQWRWNDARGPISLEWDSTVSGMYHTKSPVYRDCQKKHDTLFTKSGSSWQLASRQSNLCQ